LFEIEIVLFDVDDTDPNEIVDGADGVDVIDGAAVQLNVKLTIDWFGSLVDRARVSTNGGDGLDPVGGVHTIEMIHAGEPWFKLEIGRDPAKIENHEPIESDPD